MDFIEFISKQDNQVIMLMGMTIISLSGVIIYQWKHTQKKTVPKWAWNDLVGKIEKIRDKQLSEFGKIIEILRHIE